ncbi:MAG: amidase [Chloroflexi bacterium]|nr:amidase [Chloroflexota bacterium]
MTVDGENGTPGLGSVVSRRALLRTTVIAAGAAASVAELLQASDVGAQTTAPATPTGTPQPPNAVFASVIDRSIADLNAAMDAGKISSVELVKEYQARIEAIDRSGPFLNSVLELNKDALNIAASMDAERRRNGPRSPIHGMPILIKDNIDTADSMHTTAGSLALVNSATPSQDATIAARLREAGAVILGKTNLSEWANFRSSHSTSGWSGRGGQNNMPFVLDRNPCGSSSGSGVAAAASLAAATIATETDGSVVCPAGHNGIAGIKPTVGITSRAGVIPISHVQDTIGTHGRILADAAAVLGTLVGVDSRDAATSASAGHFQTNYLQYLDPHALNGAKIGAARNVGFGIHPRVDAIMENAINALKDAGATVIDVKLNSNDDKAVSDAETQVLMWDFKADIAKYLSTRPGGPQTLADLIAYNNADAARELKWFGQETFEASEKKDLNDTAGYNAALQTSQGKSRDDINTTLSTYGLDAFIGPTNSPSWVTDLVNGDHFVLASSSPCARAGYPIVTVPAGFSFGLPVGISFYGTAWSEPKLIALAYAFEQITHARQTPQYLPTMGERT